MRGKLYNIQASLKSVELDSSPTGKFTFNRKIKDRPRISHRSLDKTPIKYFWKASIPNKWTELVDKDKIVQFKDILGTTRNTLAFLEETQKYIHHICKPIVFKDAETPKVKPVIIKKQTSEAGLVKKFKRGSDRKVRLFSIVAVREKLRRNNSSLKKVRSKISKKIRRRISLGKPLRIEV